MQPAGTLSDRFPDSRPWIFTRATRHRAELLKVAQTMTELSFHDLVNNIIRSQNCSRNMSNTVKPSPSTALLEAEQVE